MNLFEINREIENCLVIDDSTGEVSIDEERLQGLQMEREQKIENLALYIKNLAAEASAIKAEKLVMAERQRRTEAKVDRLKEYLTAALSGEKFSSPRVMVNWRTTARVEIDEDTFLGGGNLQYCKTKIEPDKAAIKTALQQGVKITGAELVECRTMAIR